MIKKIKYLFDYFKYLKNPFSALLFKFGQKKEVELKIKSTNKTVKVNDVDILNNFMSRIPNIQIDKHSEFMEYINDVCEDKEVVKINGINFINVLNKNFKKQNSNKYHVDYEEFFTGDEWDMVPLNNRHVIDIGANVADSPLYFAKGNANVIAFEPVKHLYELGIKNISLNPKLKDKIIFINKAVGGKRGKMNINTKSTENYINSEDSYKIEVITIPDVINMYNFKPDILKMDCEGCEFEIILNYNLNMFNDIIFEHHTAITGIDYNQLIDKLKKQGFKIDKYCCNNCPGEFKDIGIIHAYK